MGLAAPRKRRKLGQDPNNTTWARASDSFGAKILSAQGWTPGSFLGAHDAPQAEHYSTASASHIRVAFKEDNLGLGARLGNSDRENFGSAMFSDILGRLNGKTEQQLGDAQRERADLGRRIYAEQKYGSTRFVRGGFLVGEKVESLASSNEHLKPLSGSTVCSTKSGKAAGSIETCESNSQNLSSESGELQHLDVRPNDGIGMVKDTSPEGSKKHKREKSSSLETRSSVVAPRSPEPGKTNPDNMTNNSHQSMTQSKSERRKRKLEKRARREARRQGKANQYATQLEEQPKSAVVMADGRPDPSNAEHIAATQRQPAPPRPSRLLAGSRHHVRQRYIHQKRMASMDPQSLREILMVKS